jgi:CheY-like chemotaxis protein
MITKQKVKILLAEDDHDLREIISIHLYETFNLEIVTATNGAEAIEKLQSDDSFDLIISDFLMPIKNGKNVLEFNILKRNIPFIMMTATEVKKDEKLSRLESFHPLNKLFMKPFPVDALCDHIHYILKSIQKL